MAGWIKIHRELGKHWLAQDMEKLGRWVDLLLLASYDDNKVLVGNQVVEVKRGQFIGSLSFLGNRWKVSRDKVASFLRVLEAEGMIKRETDRNVTQITICNYDSYQDMSDTFSTPSLHLLDTSPTPTRQTKEIQEIQEIYNTSTTHACVREEEYIARYRKEGMWQDVAMILHKSIEDCTALFDRFIVEYQHNGDKHRDYSDFKKHFIQWARVTIQKETKQVTTNGNKNRQDYSRRGRADVPAEISVDF